MYLYCCYTFFVTHDAWGGGPEYASSLECLLDFTFPGVTRRPVFVFIGVQYTSGLMLPSVLPSKLNIFFIFFFIFFLIYIFLKRTIETLFAATRKI